MFGLGWSEMMLVGIVALIVVGPQELPGLFRKMGQFTAKARGMARDFSRAMNDAADTSGIKEIESSIRSAANPTQAAYDKFRQSSGLTKDAIKPGGETEKLSKERAEAKAKVQEAMAKAGEKRLAAEANEAAKAQTSKAAAPAKAKPKAAPKKSAPKKAPAKKGDDT